MWQFFGSSCEMDLPFYTERWLSSNQFSHPLHTEINDVQVFLKPLSFLDPVNLFVFFVHRWQAEPKVVGLICLQRQKSCGQLQSYWITQTVPLKESWVQWAAEGGIDEVCGGSGWVCGRKMARGPQEKTWRFFGGTFRKAEVACFEVACFELWPDLEANKRHL